MPNFAPDRTHSAGAGQRVAVLVLAVLQILTPVLPLLGVGEPIGSQSDSVRTLITPAGWAFSIWGALYTGSLAFAVFQVLPSQRNSNLLAALRWPAAGAFLGNALWAAYTQVFGLSVVSVGIIVFTLCCLLGIYRRFARWPEPFTAGERWFAVLPLSALAAWLSAATIVNVAAALRFHGVQADDLAPTISAAVVVVGGTIAAVALARGRGNPPYALVFLWALAAIHAAGGQTSTGVAVASIVAAGLVVGGAIVGLRRGGTPGSQAPKLNLVAAGAPRYRRPWPGQTGNPARRRSRTPAGAELHQEPRYPQR
jgi:hypothetical protein